jgi:predicted TIM-barrel fold metal-dependent hydrolase
MIDGIPVINAVVHPYDLSVDNVASDVGAMVREGFYQLHAHWNPPEVQAPRAWFHADQTVEVLAGTLFLESDVDLAVYHTLRMHSLFHDGLCGHAKNVQLQQRWPERFFGYAGVDPTLGVQRCLDDLDQQVAELPNLIGLKMYPDQVNPYRTFRMDDPSLCFPIYERARALGLRTIAIHKALPNGPVPLAPYRIDDVEGAAMAFPDLNFEIVHAGMAFVEETAYALARFPNVYANLEVTTLLLHKAPRLFQETLAVMLFWGGPTKIIWADGANFAHPDAMLRRFWDLQIDEDILDRYKLPQLDRDTKACILGQNYADMAGIDLPGAIAAVADDEWARERAHSDRLAPYTVWGRAVGQDHAEAMRSQDAAPGQAGFTHPEVVDVAAR